jgi:hypothetical protein
MNCIYLCVFIGSVCFLWGLWVGNVTGKNKEYEKWLERGFTMKPKRRKK